MTKATNAILVARLAAGFLPRIADAATVRVEVYTDVLDSSISTVIFKAEAGETNALEANPDATDHPEIVRYSVRDLGDTVSAGPGCSGAARTALR